ncbi:nuclear transport factor 2 family protein [Segniliparus rugosus]|uniref:SnoaL-like domain-containing protein n=1 Tax=Segniliparus rugosus (strain ATCC BAA-974 / DSM 45345 / CCUG 50838 / CIP 108380 / JCM 13579 / CDC 945) TaxID=679197 RepID=E5XKX8_SEGRC|nr:nuclear transport factor 2 family protein [Segniliparus rugosus]EFV14960.1 hypothetical protein HMPREF9336_00147 [Segniliparus rugosus ATCC BAA-974]
MEHDARRPDPPRLSSDPRGFVAEAERMTNARDIAAIRPIFGPEATWTSVIDGIVMTAAGHDEILRKWEVMCRFMDLREMFVRKTLVASGADVVVNEWTGVVAGRPNARGVEVWHFDASGRVDRQQLYGYLNTGPETGVARNARMFATSPITAAAFAFARLSVKFNGKGNS